MLCIPFCGSEPAGVWLPRVVKMQTCQDCNRKEAKRSTVHLKTVLKGMYLQANLDVGTALVPPAKSQ